MKIELVQKPWKFFDEINVGEVFAFENVAYMKIKGIYFEENGLKLLKFNAVNLFTGKCLLMSIALDVEVLGRLEESIDYKNAKILKAEAEEGE